MFVSEDARLFPYKDFRMLQSRPPSSRWRYSGGQGGHIITTSSPGRLLVVMRRLGTEVASRHYPASHMRPEANPVPLGLAEFFYLEIYCYVPDVFRDYFMKYDFILLQLVF